MRLVLRSNVDGSAFSPSYTRNAKVAFFLSFILSVFSKSVDRLIRSTLHALALYPRVCPKILSHPAMRPILIFLCPIALLAAAPTDPDFNDILVEDSSANDLPFDSLALEPTPDDNTPLNVESPTASNVILAFPGEVPPPQPIPMDFASGDGVKCGNGDNLFCSRDYNANSGSINHVARCGFFS